MNNLRNRVNLIGRLGAQPEVNTLDSGTKMARFSIAVNNTYKDREGKYITDTQWHTINAWGAQADLVARLLQKGQEVALEGRLVNRSYQSKDGEKKYVTNIELQEFLLIGSKVEQ